MYGAEVKTENKKDGENLKILEKRRNLEYKKIYKEMIQLVTHEESGTIKY